MTQPFLGNIDFSVEENGKKITQVNISRPDEYNKRKIFYLSDLPSRLDADKLFWETIAQYFGCEITLDQETQNKMGIRGVIKHPLSDLELECGSDFKSHKLRVRFPLEQDADYLQGTLEDLNVFPYKIDGDCVCDKPQKGRDIEVFTLRGHAKHLFYYLKRIMPSGSKIPMDTYRKAS